MVVSDKDASRMVVLKSYCVFESLANDIQDTGHLRQA